jgi:hypothetical protein
MKYLIKHCDHLSKLLPFFRFKVEVMGRHSVRPDSAPIIDSSQSLPSSVSSRTVAMGSGYNALALLLSYSKAYL